MYFAVKRVLVFNFLGGVIDRGIPLYTQDIAECMRRVGLQVVELRCPRILRRAPRMLRNALFSIFEQLVAPVTRVVCGCAITVYPYNSAGLIDAVLGRSVLVVHDLISNRRDTRKLAAIYIRCTQAFHRRLGRPICAASAHTLTCLRRLPAFSRCPLYLWSNPFYAFEAVVAGPRPPAERVARRAGVLLCSGLGNNKDYAGALSLFAHSKALQDVELRIIGFGDDAHLARRRVQKLPREIRERIVVLPRLSLSQIAAEYTNSDLTWVHSRSEGFGRSIVEARLCGRPVVASRIGAFQKFAQTPGVYLYRSEDFDATVVAALGGESTPRLDAAEFHDLLESAVREVLQNRATDAA